MNTSKVFETDREGKTHLRGAPMTEAPASIEIAVHPTLDDEAKQALHDEITEVIGKAIRTAILGAAVKLADLVAPHALIGDLLEELEHDDRMEPIIMHEINDGCGNPILGDHH